MPHNKNRTINVSVLKMHPHRQTHAQYISHTCPGRCSRQPVCSGRRWGARLWTCGRWFWCDWSQTAHWRRGGHTETRVQNNLIKNSFMLYFYALIFTLSRVCGPHTVTTDLLLLLLLLYKHFSSILPSSGRYMKLFAVTLYTIFHLFIWFYKQNLN